MRIPLEALMQYAIKRPPDENRRTEPTEAAPDLNDTLEDNTGQWLPPKDPAQLTQPTTAFTLPKAPSEWRGNLAPPCTKQAFLGAKRRICLPAPPRA